MLFDAAHERLESTFNSPDVSSTAQATPGEPIAMARVESRGINRAIPNPEMPASDTTADHGNYAVVSGANDEAAILDRAQGTS